MHIRSFSHSASRWQQRLRALSLLVLLGAGGTSAGLVLAQAESDSGAGTAASSPDGCSNAGRARTEYGADGG